MYSLYFNHVKYENGQRVYTKECFYDDSIPTPEYKIISPTLKKEVGKAGSLSFLLPPTNVCYEEIDRELSEIICYKFDKELWRGRIFSDNVDFYKQRSITCEGELTYLNDTCAGTKYWKNSQGGLITYYTFIGQLLDVHNQKNEINGEYIGPYDKRIYRGIWPAIQDNGRASFETKNETVLELINSIAKDNNLYPKITWDDRGNGLKRYLDFVKGAPAGIANNLGETRTTIVDNETTNPVVELYDSVHDTWYTRTCITNDLVTYNNSQHIYNGSVWTSYHGGNGRYFNDVVTQEIVFGENLLDFARSYDPTQIVTAVILRGSKIDTDDNSDAYIDLTTIGEWTEDGIKHPANADYIYNVLAVQNFGFREAGLEVETAGTTQEQINQLKQIGKNYLRVTQFSSMKLEVSAIDLNHLGVNVDDFDIFYDVRVISYPHGLDRWFPIMSMEIPLMEIENSKYSLGVTEDITLTGAGQRANDEFYNMIKSLPTEETVLNAAKNQASGLIKGAMTGYITIRQNQNGESDAIIISQDPDWEHSQHGMWVWNSGGLGYFPNGWDGSSLPNNAMTSNGEIVADRITTGTLSAERIRGGNLIVATSSQMQSGPWTNIHSNYMGFNKGSLSSPIEVGYIKPQVVGASQENWMVYNSDVHCYECEGMTVGNSDPVSGNDHISILAFGSANDTYTIWHPGTTYTNNDSEHTPSDPLKPPLGSNVYMLDLLDRVVYFKRGLAIAELSTLGSRTLFTGTRDGHDYINGLLLEDEPTV